MSEFGKVVQALRQDSGLTLEQLGRKIGSHKGYISGIENGKVSPPSIRYLKKMHHVLQIGALDIPLEDFVELAWVQKSPVLIRERELKRIRATNPLFRIRVKPAQMVVEPAKDSA